MKFTAAFIMAVMLSGCAAVDWVKTRWPRAHDSQLVSSWVEVHQAVAAVRCDSDPQGWAVAVLPADRLALYSEFRHDPQSRNLRALSDHIQKMNQGASRAFCELGKKSAAARLDVARTAWENR